MKARKDRFFVFVLGGVGLAAAVLSFVPARPVFVWNFSASAPVGLYRVLDRPWVKGDWVAVRLSPPMEQVMALYRTPTGRPYLVKRVVAAKGDEVCRRRGQVTVNGIVVAIALDRSQGRRLPSWGGCLRLSEREVFVLGISAHSFDGRYLGPIPASAALFVIDPVGFY